MTSQEYVSEMIPSAKMTLRITTNAYDSEISELLAAALLDLGVAGVIVPSGDTVDELIRRACLTYVRMNFGQPDDYDRLKVSYDEQKGQLTSCTGYTNWEPDHV